MSISNTNGSNSSSNSGTQSSIEQAAAQTLAQLIDDVQAGDLTNARTCLTTLTQQSGFNQNGETGSPLGTLLTELVGSLGNGNINAAQASVGTFITTLQGNTTTPYTGNHREPAATGVGAPGVVQGEGAGSENGYRDPLLQAIQEEEFASASAGGSTPRSRG